MGCKGQIGIGPAIQQNTPYCDELYICSYPGIFHNQCFKATTDNVFYKTMMVLTLDYAMGSYGGGIYNNAFELVVMNYAADGVGNSTAIPMALMRDKINEIRAKYGNAAAAK